MSPMIGWAPGRGRGAASGILGVGLTLLAGCTDVGVEKPKPPDVTELVAAYRQPSGFLTDENVAEVVAALEAKLRAGQLLCGWDAAADLLCAGTEDCPLRTCTGLTDLLGSMEDVLDLDLEDGGPAVPDGGPRADGVKLDGKGYVRLERICPGHGPEPVPDEDANGKIQLTLGFTEDGLDPVGWGTVERCLLMVQVPIQVDGSLVFVFSDGPWDPRDGLAPLVRVEAEAIADSERIAVDFDFGFDLELGEILLSLGIADGSTFVFFAEVDRSGFRAADGEWDCDFGARVCSSGAASVSW